MKSRGPPLSAQAGWQHLDRDVAIQARVARPIYLAHSARAYWCNDFIGTEPSAVGECHEEANRVRGAHLVPHGGGDGHSQVASICDVVFDESGWRILPERRGQAQAEGVSAEGANVGVDGS